MFTVTVGRDASGKSSTRAPLASRYSVTPSIEATLTGGSAIAVSPTTRKSNRTQATDAWRTPPESFVDFGIIVRENAAR